MGLGRREGVEEVEGCFWWELEGTWKISTDELICL